MPLLLRAIALGLIYKINAMAKLTTTQNGMVLFIYVKALDTYISDYSQSNEVKESLKST